MKTARRRVLLTGATGNWGRATLRELLSRDKVDVVAFAMPTEGDRRVLAEFAGRGRLEIFWGDLTRYEDVARAIAGVDTILHVGAVVSPLADAYPRLARRVNVGSMQNIIRAVKALPDPASVEVVGIGSVAETGDRQAPVHWGRVGDPIRVSQFDEYGQTKVIAEKLLVDSGLPRWAWLRQTGIFHPGMLEIRDPIMTHSPFAGVLEWVSDVDSARLLAAIAEGAPEAFWQGIYNIGGGEGWRLTNWELQNAIGRAMGVADIRKWYDREWFALTNFHGQWYTDSDHLDELVPFRHDTWGAAMSRALAAAPASVRNAGKVPAWIVKNFVMKPLAHKPRGTMHAVRCRDNEEVGAHFGSSDRWARIGDWSQFQVPEPSRTPSFLDHGYDESLPVREWSTSMYRDAASFRGGELLSGDAVTGDIATPLVWRCAFGHVFAASPRLVLTGGHWCPECVRDAASYRAQAERSPFLAQVEFPQAALVA